MRRNIIILCFIALISVVFGSVIFYFAGLNGREEIKLSGRINVVADSDNYEVVLKAAESFKKIHGRVEINIVKSEDSYKKISDEVKGNKFKEDVVIVSEEYVKPLVKMGSNSFLDVGSDISGINEVFSEGRMNAVTDNKKIYAYPWTAKPVAILYRSDIFSSEGINIDDIKTWDDLRILGKNLAARTGKKFLVYQAPQFGRLNNALLSQLRISYSDKTNSKRVSDLINAMVYEGTLYGSESIMTMMKKDWVMAVLVTPEDVVNIMKMESQKGKWGIMKLPAFEPGGNRDVSLGGYDILINKDTKNINLSREFSKYLASDSTTAYDNLMNNGMFTAAYSLYNRQKFNNSNDFFNTNIWSIFLDIEKNAPENKY